MSKQDEAGLLLKLYELRREETMRKARDWYVRDFHPDSMADFQGAMFSEHSNYLRMVVTYWDMAAALVNHGAISVELFSETSGECVTAFSKIEPLLGEIRAAFGPQFAANLEKLIEQMPNGRERTEAVRERIKGMRARFAAGEERSR